LRARLKRYSIRAKPQPLETVNVLKGGARALEKANKEMGLAAVIRRDRVSGRELQEAAA